MAYGVIVEGLWASMPYTGVQLYFIFRYHYRKQEIADGTGKPSNDRQHDKPSCRSYRLKGTHRSPSHCPSLRWACCP